MEYIYNRHYENACIQVTGDFPPLPERDWKSCENVKSTTPPPPSTQSQ